MGRRSKSSKKQKPKQKEMKKHQPKPQPHVEASVDMPPLDGTALRWFWLSALLIALAVVGVYQNTQENEFLTFDDRKYIYENEFVIGDGGLGAIWGDLTNKNPRLHFNPMTYTTFWIEHELVGLEPPDVDTEKVLSRAAHPLYHWTQIVLHAINAFLVLLAIRALGVSFPVTLFTALFFALHPVNVASVAWMAERKTLVSALFMWVTFLLYVHHRRRRAETPWLYLALTGAAYLAFAYFFMGNTLAAATALTASALFIWRACLLFVRRTRQDSGMPWFYLAAIATFAIALVSKGACAVLAPVLVVTDRVLDRRWSWAAVSRSMPFFAMGIFMAKIISSREALIAKSWTPTEVIHRPFIAVSALVHYVVKMLVPVKQAIIYPRWAESLANPRFWISLAIVIAAAYLIRRYRRWLGDLWLWGLALFLITIGPVLGLKHFIWMQFAFVSDHYMYYGSPGVLLMFGLLLEKWFRPSGEGTKPRPERLAVVAVACLVALVGCGWRVVQQNRTWKNNETLWTHTLTVSPDCALANGNLGNSYFRHGRFEEALERYKEWVRIEPDFARARRSCARALKRLGRADEAIEYYQAAIAIAESKSPGSWSIRAEYADYLLDLRRYARALAEYEEVLRRSPPNPAPIAKRVEQLRQALRRQGG